MHAPPPVPTDAQRRADAEALFFEGNRCMASGDDARAESLMRMAIAVHPEFAEAHANLALLLDRRGALDAAQSAHERSLALDAGNSRAHLNYANHLAARKRFADAESAYRAALRCAPDDPAIWSNLGVLYACLYRDAEAAQCYERALALSPDHANARFNHAYLLLRQGRFETGWQQLEARPWLPLLAERVPGPRWQGESLVGKGLLIVPEGGHGDMIQFCRYAPLVKARHGAARIVLICPTPLKPLLVTLDGIDEVRGLDEPLPASGWDCWCPLLSLPYRCTTRLDSVPAALPYLHAPPARLREWAPRLPTGGLLRVGLVWRGSTQFENDADRSLPALDTLAPLAHIDGVRWISLQKGAGENEAAHPPAGFALTDIGPALRDFADTAAIVAQLDLVISVDTAVAHLAGALGIPCWVLLPAYKPDWRWLAHRDDTPWYPGVMHLFRQERIGDWDAPIARLAQALADLANHRAPRT